MLLRQNLDLAAAFARVQQARAVAARAGAQLLPTLDFDATGTAEHQSLLSPVGTIAKTFPATVATSADTTLGLPRAGKSIWPADCAAAPLRRVTKVQAAELSNSARGLRVAADAADAYLQVRGFQTRLAVAQDQIDTDGRLLELVRVRRRAGAADERRLPRPRRC